MRKTIYDFGIASFLAMLIFTIATSLSNPFYGMSEAAIAQASSSTSNTGSGWEKVCCGPQCAVNGVPGDYCLGSGSFTCCK